MASGRLFEARVLRTHFFSTLMLLVGWREGRPSGLEKHLSLRLSRCSCSIHPAGTWENISENKSAAHTKYVRNLFGRTIWHDIHRSAVYCGI